MNNTLFVTAVALTSYKKQRYCIVLKILNVLNELRQTCQNSLLHTPVNTVCLPVPVAAEAEPAAADGGAAEGHPYAAAGYRHAGQDPDRQRQEPCLRSASARPHLQDVAAGDAR